jgi:hypothetical protein
MNHVQGRGFSFATFIALGRSFIMKKNSFGAVVFALLVGAAVATGCGGSDTIIVVDPVTSICEDICACTRCTRNDLAACEDETNTSWAAASEAGCSDQFQNVVACVSANVTCVQDEAVTVGCDAQQEALDVCAAGLDPFRPSICDLAGDALDAKYAACGVRLPPATPRRVCTDSLASTLDCVTACYEAVSCAYLQCDDGDVAACDEVAPDEALAFADCIVACR